MLPHVYHHIPWSSVITRAPHLLVVLRAPHLLVVLRVQLVVGLRPRVRPPPYRTWYISMYTYTNRKVFQQLVLAKDAKDPAQVGTSQVAEAFGVASRRHRTRQTDGSQHRMPAAPNEDFELWRHWCTWSHIKSPVNPMVSSQLISSFAPLLSPRKTIPVLSHDNPMV